MDGDRVQVAGPDAEDGGGSARVRLLGLDHVPRRPARSAAAPGSSTGFQESGDRVAEQGVVVAPPQPVGAASCSSPQPCGSSSTEVTSPGE